MSDLALVATTLKVAEKSKILYEESPNYTEEELVADIGGSLGLILGLNLLDVLIFSGSGEGLQHKKSLHTVCTIPYGIYNM